MTLGTRPRRTSRSWQDAQQTQRDERPGRGKLCMDRPGIEPTPFRMLSGCDTTTPTAPELSRPRVLKYLLRIAFSAEGLEGAASPALAPAAERKRKETKGVRRQQKGRLDALLCPQREPTKGVRRQQKGSAGA